MGDRGSAAARSGAAGVWAVVAAAGSGARFGAPKQFADLGCGRCSSGPRPERRPGPRGWWR